MPDLLSSAKLSAAVEEIVTSAKKHLVIVSPYLRFNRIIYERLFTTVQHGVPTVLLYGKSELSSAEERKVKAIDRLAVFYLDNLHAKVYLNESKAVVTSLNLHEYSERNNWEIGVTLGPEEGTSWTDLLTERSRHHDSRRGAATRSIRRRTHPSIRLRDAINELFPEFAPRIEQHENPFSGSFASIEVDSFGYPGLSLSVDDRRSEFVVSIPDEERSSLLEKLERHDFGPNYRVYVNDHPPEVTVYKSEFYRDRWSTVNTDARIEYVCGGVSLVGRFLLSSLKSITTDT